MFDEQIDRAVAAIQLNNPVVALAPGWGNSIYIQYNNRVEFDPQRLDGVDTVILDTVKSKARLILNLSKNAYRVDISYDDVKDSVYYSVIQDVQHFLRNRGGFANNRLSKIYKWYNEKFNERIMSGNPDIAKDLYNIAKFIRSNDSDEHNKTVRTLLELIKNRYEPRLGPV